MAWQSRGRCAEVDPDLFYPEIGNSYAPSRVCTGCEVRQQCLDWAVDTHQEFGIWGGLGRRARQRYRRQRERRAA